MFVPQVTIDLFEFFMNVLLKPHQRNDRIQTGPNMRKPYETYTKTYEGNTWRGPDGSINNDRFVNKQPNGVPRFPANAHFNGIQNDGQQNLNGVADNKMPPTQYDMHGKPVSFKTEA